MKLATLLAVFLAGTTFAAVENIGLSRDHVTCDGTRYTSDDIEIAANAALALHNAKRRIGPHPAGDRRNYPHRFYNDENLALAPACVGGNALEEFPLTRTYRYTGGEARTQRVVVNYVNANDVRYVYPTTI
ncbi:hypothetical protein AWENTII_011891 [Aspergillus wentii]